jgi:hypothetical protein
MTEKIEFTVPDAIVELLRNACLSDNLQKFARALFLKGLAAEYMAMDDDNTARKIEAITEKLGA